MATNYIKVSFEQSLNMPGKTAIIPVVMGDNIMTFTQKINSYLQLSPENKLSNIELQVDGKILNDQQTFESIRFQMKNGETVEDRTTLAIAYPKGRAPSGCTIL
ncbi:hypothetical protein H4R24_003259 [Coemansia sp. RSA 988]|nr:hypothetical protein H4R24_003259 [Coemansia sp. RSA 988]